MFGRKIKGAYNWYDEMDENALSSFATLYYASIGVQKNVFFAQHRTISLCNMNHERETKHIGVRNCNVIVFVCACVCQHD